jgi:CheY-like chemotaxis protein
VIERVLEEYGYTVLAASDGTEALALEARHAAPIDLLLSDLVMPELGGPELATRLARRRPFMKVLYMSAAGDHVARPSGATDVQAGFLSKPFTPEALARKVREVLNRPRSPVPDEQHA